MLFGGSCGGMYTWDHDETATKFTGSAVSSQQESYKVLHINLNSPRVSHCAR